MSREEVQKQCEAFLQTLGAPGFIILGWHKPDGTLDIVQSVRDLNIIAYTKAVAWALNEVTKNL